MLEPGSTAGATEVVGGSTDGVEVVVAGSTAAVVAGLIDGAMAAEVHGSTARKCALPGSVIGRHVYY